MGHKRPLDATERAQKAAEELRTATREAHEVLQEFRELRQRLTAQLDELRGWAERRVTREVQDELAAMGGQIQEAMRGAVAKVGSEFERLERLFLEGDEGAPTLEELVYLSSQVNWTRPPLHWIDGEIHQTPRLTCPHCGACHDAHRADRQREDEGPRTGAVSLCVECWEFSVFEDADGDLTLRLPTPDEAAKIQRDRRVMRSRARAKYGLE